MEQHAGTEKVKSGIFDVEKVRKDFPILNTQVNGQQLVYLDNAATTQKPRQVIESIKTYYETYNANIHRGVHQLSQKASQAYDDSRQKIASFINATSASEIVFVSGTTHGINTVASSFGAANIREGDEIIISAAEHHANIVPWQMLCERNKAVLKVIPVDEAGQIKPSDVQNLISKKTKLISVFYVSNALGTVNPVKEIIELAHKRGIKVLLDAAQALAHFPVDVQDLDCDFMAFSAHKMLGPTGTGVLYGKALLLEEMPPFMGGGDMIESVSFLKTTYNDVPIKFEAGTPNVEAVIAFGAAIDYWNSLNRDAIADYESDLFSYTLKELLKIPHLKVWGPGENGCAVLSFSIDRVNALDAGLFLDTKGIAVRTGQHCAEPLMDRLGIPGTIRASIMFYNTKEEMDFLIQGLKDAIKLLRR